jgi:hypothetical protein
MSRPLPKTYRPGVEAIEGRQLLSTATLGHAADWLGRGAPIVHASPLQYTILVQFGGTPTGAPGQTVTVQAGLAVASGRTGIYSALTGRRVDLYMGSTLVGSASTNHQVISGHDTYGVASFTFRIPANAAHGSAIRLQFRFAGDQLDGASTGSGQVNVR